MSLIKLLSIIFGLGMALTSCSEQTMRNKTTYEIIQEELLKKEGKKNHVYKDSRNLLTYGVGHLVTAEDVKDLGLTGLVKEVKVGGTTGYKLVEGENAKFQYLKNSKGKIYDNKVTLNGKPLTVDEEKVNDTFSKDLESKYLQAKASIPDLDSMGASEQAAAVSGFFRGDLSGSPKTLRLINQGKFEEAAKEFLDHKEYKTTDDQGIKSRMEGIASNIRTMGMSQRGYEMMPDDGFNRPRSGGRDPGNYIQRAQAALFPNAYGSTMEEYRKQLEAETGIQSTLPRTSQGEIDTAAFMAPDQGSAMEQSKGNWWDNPLTDWMKSFR